ASGSEAEPERRLQVALHLARHLGPGQEVLDGWQLVQRIEPEALEEEVSGAEEGRLPGSLGVTDHLDVAALLEQSRHALDVDAAQRRDLTARHRLAIGDDGQSLERRRRQ